MRPVAIVLASTLAWFMQQETKLTGTGAVGNAFQGRSTSISADGNTAIVGGNLDNGSVGALWAWTRNAGVWTQQGGKLTGSGTVGSANLGTAAALSSDGNTAIVGAPADNSNAGAAWIFTRSAGVWTQQGSKLVGAGAIGSSQQGWSVGISGDGNTAIVGGPLDGSASGGAAWIFTRSGGVWTQQGNKLVGAGAQGISSRQGWSVALSSDGNTAIVGGYGDNAAHGAAWVWTRSGGVWTQQGTKLVGLGGTSGVGNEWQGWAVALSSDGNTAIIGAVADNNNTGAVWIWTRVGTIWLQQSTKIIASGNPGAALFGNSVALSADGNTAIVGGSGGNGAAWVLARSGSLWSEQEKLIGSGATGGEQQGSSVDISADGSTVIVGGPLDKGFAGAAWIFVRTTLPVKRHAARH